MRLTHPQEVIDFLNQHWWSKVQRPDLRPADTHEQAIHTLLNLHRAYLDGLHAMPPEELAREVLEALTEQDLERPFNKFGTDADYEHYGRCAFLTVDEAVALSLGKDPRYVDWSTVEPYLGNSLFAQRYADLLDLVDRAIIWDELPERFSPLQFLTWAHQYKVVVPDGFISCTFDRGEPIKYWHDLCAEIQSELEATLSVLEAHREALESVELERERDEQRTFEGWLAAEVDIDRLRTEHEHQTASLQKQLGDAQTLIAALKQQVIDQRIAPVHEKPVTTTGRNSLLTIAIAAAVDGHGYDPNGKRNSAAREIADSATKLGLKMTGETVLKYLKEAAELENFVAPDMVQRKPKSAKRKPKSD